jgi:hypothetical protein
MKNKLLIIGAIFCLIIGLNACKYSINLVRGDGHIIKTEINIGKVSGIELRNSIDVEIIKSDTFRIELYAQQNIAEYIFIERKSDIAIIRTKPFINIIPTEPTKIVFYMPEVDYLQISGSGNIYSDNTFTTENISKFGISGSGDIYFGIESCELEIDISGSGNIDLYCKSDKTVSNIYGSGDILLTGDCFTHKIKISGTGKVDALEYENTQSYVKITGSGDAYVNPTTYLDVNISGSGNVIYKGNPTISTKITGSGSILPF